MKKQILLLSMGLLSLGVMAVGCGPTAAQKERMEQERQDSIRLVREEEIQDSICRDSIIRIRKANIHEDLKRDSIEIANLLPNFKKIQDPAFDNKYKFVYKGISTSHFTNNIYLSFEIMQNNLEGLMLNIDTRGEWMKSTNIDISYAKIIIGNDSYDISPVGGVQFQYDEKDSDIWGEWMSGELSSYIMDKILEANAIKIDLIGSSIGSNGNKLISVSSSDLNKMKETIRLYKLITEYGPEKTMEF